jgi:iron complex outermembrane receptor protein
MKLYYSLALAGVSLVSLTNAAYAQEDVSRVNEGASSSGEIIVTARRRDESLQDVPATVNAVTNETIQKLNLQNFKDIQAIVPGLSLSGGVAVSDSTFSLRGITSTTLAQTASPTVQFYLNEATIDANSIFQSMFDVGQIEVLRGPQGTLRGKSAPSGAITLTTRRADVDEVGGYASLSGTNRRVNGNGAINLPIVPGVLAVRIGALIDHSDLDGVRSVNNGTAPFGKSEAVRGSLTFKPTDTIEVYLMAQRLWAHNRSFQQVAGFSTNPLSGPTIAAGDRLAVVEGPVDQRSTYDFVSANASWRFAGQKLSYVGAYSKAQNFSFSDLDTYNAFPGYAPTRSLGPSGAKQWRHELRLASEDRIAGLFDYTVGIYHDQGKGLTVGVIPPATPFNPITTYLAFDTDSSETSFYGTGTLHLGDSTEITGGARHISFKTQQQGPYNQFGVGGTALCLVSSITIPGFAAGVPLCLTAAGNPAVQKDSKVVWNASVSHKFTDDFMVYGNIGTSYRSRFNVVSFSDFSPPGFQSIEDLYRHPPETSRGEEIGFKASFLDKRARLNVAAFHQTFKDYSFYVTDIRMLDRNSNSVVPTNFTATADTVVWGVDVDASFQVTPNFSMSAGFAWAKGTVKNDEVPCNDPNFTTAAQFTAGGVLVARCISNRSVSTAPRWSLTLQSEYSHPVSDHVDGFVRGLFSYYPNNPYASESVTIGSYGLLNVYAGIRSPDNAWEVSVFAKNASNTSQLLSQSNLVPPVSGVPINYRAVNYTARREIGLNVRYAFGSR